MTTSKHGTALLTNAPRGYDFERTTHEVDAEYGQYRLLIVSEEGATPERQAFLAEYQIGRYSSGMYETVCMANQAFWPKAEEWETRRLEILQALLDGQPVTLTESDFRLNENLDEDIAKVATFVRRGLRARAA